MIVKNCCLVFGLLVGATTATAEPIDVGSRREPLVDDYLIESMNGTSLVLHQPVRREVAVTHDRPWEGNVSAYHTVFQDGDLYRMYYRGWHIGATVDGMKAHGETVCYAQSKDGVHWTKPELDLVEFDGSKKNNIVLRSVGTHNFAPFKDANPACQAQQRYKALGSGRGGLVAFQSADGIHWSLIQEKAVITKGAFDSLNIAFWDASRQRYVEFHRGFRKGIRDIMTSTSTDFLHWTEPVWLEYPGAATEELYTNGILSYQGAEHIFVGLPARYMGTRPSSYMPSKDNKSRGMNGVTDAVFMTSRDGLKFHRFGEALIRPGLQTDCWITRNTYPAWGIVRTKADTQEPIAEISLYATEGYYGKGPCRLRRFTSRIDGFVSVHADSRGGQMLSKPLVFAGKSLAINYSTSAAGSVRFEIQDAQGKPISGFTLEECPEIYGDRLDQVVAWKGGSDLSKLASQPIRLRVVLKDADLYAIQFR